MNDLLYLMAHAPATVPEWFEPKTKPKPQEDPAWRFCEGCKAGDDCENNADCAKIMVHRQLVKEWEQQREVARLLQWPRFWAECQMQMGIR